MSSKTPPSASTTPTFPSTRYQGSKSKLIPWLWSILSRYPFETALDAFGGTAVVSYLLKQQGKQVTYNDILPFNVQFGRALIQNDDILLDPEDIEHLCNEQPQTEYLSIVQKHFQDIYFTEEENAWLDRAMLHLEQIQSPTKRALGFFTVAQACLAKRPFNLFHRKNLYLRFAEVDRSFGNKASWDRPFEEWIPRIAQEANQAIFRGQRPCIATSYDAAQVPGEFDLIYADPPYISEKGQAVHYADFYHFLTGLCLYREWPEQIDYKAKHRRLKRSPSPWSEKAHITQAFDDFFAAYPHAILAVSYRSDGIPSAEDLHTLLKRHRPRVEVHLYGDYQYALSKNKRSQELLFLGLP
ncbi:MAG: DNA adenine methylase [Myxococcales bacterium]|nr:DNA adenine methylase [Myxococcales bacterium]